MAAARWCGGGEETGRGEARGNKDEDDGDSVSISAGAGSCRTGPAGFAQTPVHAGARGCIMVPTLGHMHRRQQAPPQPPQRQHMVGGWCASICKTVHE